MKCKISLLVIASLILSSVVPAAGMESSTVSIEERSDIKLVIEGKQINLKQPPIEIEGKVLVPAIVFLNGIGIKNERPYLTWDAKTKNMIVNYNTLKVVFKANSKKISVNNSIQTSDVPSVYYNNTIYISLDSIAPIFEKTFARESASNTVLIRSTADFYKVRAVLKRIKEAQKGYKKAKFELYNGAYNTCGEIDRVKNIMHFTSPFYGTDQRLEMYIINNAVYFRSGTEGGTIFGDNNNWGYFNITGNMLADSFNIPLNYGNAACAGLTLTEDRKRGKLILEGDIYFDEFYKRPTIYYDITKYNAVKKAHTKYVFDSKTYLLCSGIMDIVYLYYFSNKQESDRVIYRLKDYNSSKINVSLDDQSRKNADKYESTLIGSGFEMFENYVEK